MIVETSEFENIVYTCANRLCSVTDTWYRPSTPQRKVRLYVPNFQAACTWYYSQCFNRTIKSWENFFFSQCARRAFQRRCWYKVRYCGPCLLTGVPDSEVIGSVVHLLGTCDDSLHNRDYGSAVPPLRWVTALAISVAIHWAVSWSKLPLLSNAKGRQGIQMSLSTWLFQYNWNVELRDVPRFWNAFT